MSHRSSVSIRLMSNGSVSYRSKVVTLCAHDEMTCQANDGKSKSWVMKGEYMLKKKEVSRGMHQSDVICSTMGWLADASQSMEYGKNYEGYWTGELFVKQVSYGLWQICTWICSYSCPNLSFMKRSFPLLNMPMDQDIRCFLWLITHKVMQHIPLTHFSSTI